MVEYPRKGNVKMEEEKKSIVKSWKFLAVIVPIIMIAIVGIIVIRNIALTKPKFEITNFTMSSETTEYTSIDNTTRYTGNGLITTQEKKGTYIVALKKSLKSGGDENSEKETLTTVMVSNGKGEFGTYDYGEVDKITKPEYEFEILGYIKFN